MCLNFSSWSVSLVWDRDSVRERVCVRDRRCQRESVCERERESGRVCERERERDGPVGRGEAEVAQPNVLELLVLVRLAGVRERQCQRESVCERGRVGGCVREKERETVCGLRIG